MKADIACACRSLCVTLYGINDYAVFTLYNPLYNRLHRVCALLYVAAQCIDMPTAQMLFAVVVDADYQVMQSMLGVVTDVDVSSCHVAED